MIVFRVFRSVLFFQDFLRLFVRVPLVSLWLFFVAWFSTRPLAPRLSRFRATFGDMV